jgi:hypothetical protein
MGRYRNPGLESRGMTTRRIAKAEAHSPGFSPGFHQPGFHHSSQGRGGSRMGESSAPTMGSNRGFCSQDLIFR